MTPRNLTLPNMKNLLFIDTETTGFLTKDDYDSPRQPWPVEIAALLTKPDGETVGSFEAMIKPDGWTSHPGALAVHGITEACAEENGIALADALSILDVFAERADTVLAYPARFDCAIINCAALRLGIGNPIGDLDVTCVQKMVTEWNDGKALKLLVAYEHFMKRPVKAAHCARVDASACRDVYFAVLKEKARLDNL